jgi:phosphatidate cytidylyltransferase
MAGAETVAGGRGGSLQTRVISAAVMLAVALAALAIGGTALDAFIGVVALVAFAELVGLVLKATTSWPLRIVALLAGAAYVGAAAAILMGAGKFLLIMVIGIAVFTDTGAFFAGRAIGGPKIAPSISPSKTWAGLAGGMVASALWVFAWVFLMDARFGWPRFDVGLNLSVQNTTGGIVLGALLAVVAQAGDFLESWLKRRAGVKDSSQLIPGHGGVFDRIDGLIPVVLVAGAIAAWMAP